MREGRDATLNTVAAVVSTCRTDRSHIRRLEPAKCVLSAGSSPDLVTVHPVP
jgi:hypothetical protein